MSRIEQVKLQAKQAALKARLKQALQMPTLPTTNVDTVTVAEKAIHLLDTMIEVRPSVWMHRVCADLGLISSRGIAQNCEQCAALKICPCARISYEWSWKGLRTCHQSREKFSGSRCARKASRMLPRAKPHLRLTYAWNLLRHYPCTELLKCQCVLVDAPAVSTHSLAMQLALLRKIETAF